MFYKIEWNYSREQSYADAEMTKYGKLICQTLTFAAVLPIYVCFSVISMLNRVYRKKAPHLVQREKDDSQEQSFGILESVLFSYGAMKKIYIFGYTGKRPNNFYIFIYGLIHFLLLRQGLTSHFLQTYLQGNMASRNIKKHRERNTCKCISPNYRDFLLVLPSVSRGFTLFSIFKHQIILSKIIQRFFEVGTQS